MANDTPVFAVTVSLPGSSVAIMETRVMDDVFNGVIVAITSHRLYE